MLSFVRNKFLTNFQALIECGADVRARGSRMESPLHSAVSAEVVRLLVKSGADLEAREIGMLISYLSFAL
jgi:hypothetical protein